MKRLMIFSVAVSVVLGMGGMARAQMDVAPVALSGQVYSPDQMDQLLEPIALYPDPLIGQILAASTLPSQIVIASRYVAGGGDPNQIAQQPWDPSVQGLAMYPAVLKWMDDNLPWTSALGQAFTSQQQEVMDSVQRLRARAQSLGNLQNTPQENIVSDDGDIEILPADPETIYVPVYQPDVVYFQQWNSGLPFVTFGVGFRCGAWLNHDFDWHDHRFVEWGRDHPRPGNWWSQRPADRRDFEAKHAAVWQPRGGNIVSRRGDRGYDSRLVSHPMTVARPEPVRAADHRAEPVPAPRREDPRPVVAEQPRVISRPGGPQGALIGVQSQRETQQFSARGQQSRQTMPSHPSAPSGGGGGGGKRR